MVRLYTLMRTIRNRKHFDLDQGVVDLKCRRRMKCEKDYEEAITPIEDGDLLTITPAEHESTEKECD